MAANYTVSATFMAVDKMSRIFANMSRATNKFATRAQAGFARVEMAGRRLEKRVGSMMGKLGKLGLGFSALLIAQQVATANVAIDQSLASLQAITGATTEAMVDYAAELERVSKAEKIFGAETGKVFELVGSAKPELLASAAALGEVSRQAIILSKAGKLEITDSVTALTGSLNQFGKGAEFATKFTDVLATAQQKGSGNIQFLSQAMVNAGGTAKAFGNSFEDTVAILEGFAKSGTPASESGTQLAGILAKLSTVQKKEFNPQFTKATDIINNLAKANLSYNDLIKLTDVRGAKWLTTIINQNDEVQRLTGNLNEIGNAQAQATIQTATLGKRWEELVASFKNAVTTTNSENTALVQVKKTLAFLADNMDKVIAIAMNMIKAFLIYKAVMISVVVAQKALIAVMAIAKFARFVMIIIKIAQAKGLWAAAQWTLNVAMNANPIGLIILGIAALIGLVILVVKNFDKWKTSLVTFFKKFEWLVRLVNLFKDAWSSITDAFKSGGIIEGLKQIGRSILNFLLAPIQSLLELIGRIPGVDFADTGAAKIAAFREGLVPSNSADSTNNVTEIQTTNTSAAQESLKREERIEKQQGEIILKNKSDLDVETNFPSTFPVILSNTF